MIMYCTINENKSNNSKKCDEYITILIGKIKLILNTSFFFKRLFLKKTRFLMRYKIKLNSYFVMERKKYFMHISIFML